MRYPKNADTERPIVMDVDRDAAPTGQKAARAVSVDDYTRREVDRAGLHHLDAMTERMPGMNRAQRDKERNFPRETNQPLQHPAMQRPLPAPGEVRVPFSSRQKKARSKARLEAARSMPATQFEAQRALVTDRDKWDRVNDTLSANAGDVSELSDKDRVMVGRIDRSIQAAERANTRGHVVYTNVQMPHWINDSNIDTWTQRTFTPGTTIAFDRYTVATHQLHETSGHPANSHQRTVVCEIQTRRGAYLGHSDSLDDTTHLLPRGLHLHVVGVSRENYRTPDGDIGQRTVLQLQDITPDTTGGKK